MTECRACGAVIKDGLTLCVTCTRERIHSRTLKKNPKTNAAGETEPAGVACPACGERLKPDSKKCEKCGAPDQHYSKTLKWYLKAANDGDDHAQERLGDLYLKGIGTDRDHTKAFAWYLKSAEQGNCTSKAQLGAMYEQSLGVDQDIQKALALYNEAADAGNALGQARLGDLYYRGIGVDRDYQRAFDYFQAAALKGNDHAQARLADMVLLGVGVPADPPRALKLYRQAAEQGNAHSQAQLAGMYLHGVAVEQDYRKALAWYQKAVEQGNDKALASLGHMYEKGLGVHKNFRRALELYEKSAARGHAIGLARLGNMVLNGSGVERDPKKAIAYFRKAIEQNNDLAQLWLGTMYCDGNGIGPDVKKGFELIQKSAAQGNAKAQLLLGKMYLEGKGVEPDGRKAFLWIQKSARQDHIIAQYELGRLYELGSGVEKDFRKAGECYRHAAEKGLVEAQVSLGSLYRDGLGVKENVAEAKKWFIQAAEKGNEKAKSELLKIKEEEDPKRKLKNRILAAHGGDAKAMAEVATMYQLGVGVAASEENALEWFKKALEHGNASVRGELRRLQQSIAARRPAEAKKPDLTKPIAVPPPGAEKRKPPPSRSLLFLFSMFGLIGLALAIILFNVIGKPGSEKDESPAPALGTIEVPRHEFELPVPPILETGFEIDADTTQERSTLKKNENQPAKIAAPHPAAIPAEPAAAALRREYKTLGEEEISAMLVRRNIFEARWNPGGNFRHQYEIRDIAGLRLIFDRATDLVWMTQRHPVKMSLEKIEEWIASLNRVGYGGIRSWRLPTVEEAAALLEKQAADEKIFLAEVFGRNIQSIWTGDSFTESRSWIVDFRNGLIDHAKNKNRLPALMVSSDLGR
ncbi:MAG TPA: DUF1566 domain-containing protein [Candidatus Binatia bacterium]|nr:DUF1566 domain-containing protein [Candidatus Binatia bacterium]